MENAETRYIVSHGWNLSEMDTQEGRRTLLVSGHGRYYQIGGMAGGVLLMLNREGRTLSQLQASWPLEHGGSVSMDQLRSTIDQLLKRSIIADEGAEALPPPKKAANWFGHRYFALRVNLLPARVAYPVTRRMAPLYSPYWMLRLIPALLLLHAGIWLRLPTSPRGVLSWATGPLLAALLAGNYGGLLMHELGHAAACVRTGVRHGPIGAGLYLIFPSFFTDVSESWKLPRSQRMIVDAAGIYTTLCLSTVMFALYLMTRSHLFLILTALYDLSVLLNLNPFIRMDCYWLLSDALGINNLMDYSRQTSAWLVGRILALKSAPSLPALLRGKSRVRYIFFAYYGLSLLFGAFIVERLIVTYIPGYAARVPEMVRGIRIAIGLHGVGADAAGRALHLAMMAVPMVGTAAYAIRAASRTLNFFRKS